MKYQNRKMELSEILPMEMTFSTGWAGDYVLPNETTSDLHDCLELAVNGGYNQTGGCSSPETDVSIDNVTSWLEEIQDVEIPDLENKELFTILNEDIFSDDLCSFVPQDNVITIDTKESIFFSAVPQGGVSQIVPKESSRRKQRIVPLYETLTEERFERKVDASSFNRSSGESISSNDHAELFEIIGMSQDTTNMSSRSDQWTVKQEPKARRKRGLSHVEKKDRKKESNRNASYRYRQRKKMEKDGFVQYAMGVKDQLDSAKRSYYHTAEELLRYIKHANLIRAVKDECPQLMLE